MAYRHPSGSASSIDSPEFTAPSLHPFYCPFSPDCEDQEFVQSFLDDVLLKLTAERWDAVQTDGTEQPVDLTRDEGNSTPPTAHENTTRDRLTVYNTIIAQLDAIMRHPAEEKHFPVELSSDTHTP